MVLEILRDQGECDVHDLVMKSNLTNTAVRMALVWLFERRMVTRRAGKGRGIKSANHYSIAHDGSVALRDPKWTGYEQRGNRHHKNPKVLTAKFLKARYREYHAKHVELQRRMGLPEHMIHEDFDLREFKGKGEEAA